MTTNEHDTDPSTPTARRSTEGRTGAAFDTQPLPIRTPPPPKPTTDPGLGPALPAQGLAPGAAPVEPAAPANDIRPEAGAVEPQAVPDAPPIRPMGIVVPSAPPPDPKKDSVELLLDGITGPQPERTKTKPQTDGEASASYHARHDVRAARTSPDDEPKVVIEPMQQPPTIRIDRSKLPELSEAMARAALEPTAVVPPQMGPRIVVAVVAGLLVVLALLVALRVMSRHSPAPVAGPTAPAATLGLPPPATASAIAKPEAEPGVVSAPALASAASSEEPFMPVDGAGGAATAAAAHPRPAAVGSSAASARPRPKPAASASAPKDLGELKTTFH